MNIDPNLASYLVLNEKAVISPDSSNLDPSLLDKLMENLGTLAVIYTKPPELFVKKAKRVNLGEEEDYDLEDNNLIDENDENKPTNKKIQNMNDDSSMENTISNEFSTGMEFNVNTNNTATNQIHTGANLIDLNDLLGPSTNNNSPIYPQPGLGSNLNMGINTNNQNATNMLGNLQYGNLVTSQVQPENTSNLYSTINLPNESMISLNNNNNLMDQSNFYSTTTVNQNNLNSIVNPSFGSVIGNSIMIDPSQKFALIPKMVYIIIFILQFRKL